MKRQAAPTKASSAGCEAPAAAPCASLRSESPCQRERGVCAASAGAGRARTGSRRRPASAPRGPARPAPRPAQRRRPTLRAPATPPQPSAAPPAAAAPPQCRRSARDGEATHQRIKRISHAAGAARAERPSRKVPGAGARRGEADVSRRRRRDRPTRALLSLLLRSRRRPHCNYVCTARWLMVQCIVRRCWICAVDGLSGGIDGQSRPNFTKHVRKCSERRQKLHVNDGASKKLHVNEGGRTPACFQTGT